MNLRYTHEYRDQGREPKKLASNTDMVSMQPLTIVMLIFLGCLLTVKHIFNIQSCYLHQLFLDNPGFLVQFVLSLFYIL